MKNMKPVIYKFALVAIILVVLNYIYKFTFFENDIQAHSNIINIVRNVVNEKAEVIYVGESSNISFRSDDIDKRPISDFIHDYYPTKKFGSITKEATHAGIYYELLRNIPENASAKTIIVTLNLRSFDANWVYSNLETPLQKSMVLLKKYPPLFNRFLLAFKGYDIKTDKEREEQFKEKWKNDTLKFPTPFKYKNVIDWDNAMAKYGVRNADGSINRPLTDVACQYIKTYAFQIDTITNPRIKDFDKIVLLAQERNWNLVFNLLGENVERADSLVGKELVYLIKQNRDLLVKRYHKNKVRVVDNLEAVGNSEYIDKNWTTEHYAEQGRKAIAKNVAECLKEIYSKDYVKVSYNNTKPDNFFINCDGNTPWGQTQSLTSEKSFSGEKSSKTGNKQDYSITFEYPIKGLPDSLKQVSIDMQLFQNSINTDAKLTIEISGKDIEPKWYGILVKELSTTTNKWNKANYVFTLPQNFYQANLIKVYVYNPTPSVIYIDDLNIKFKR